MNDTLNVLLLSVLQGVAEFLPISSSGHLVLGQHLLGMKEPSNRLEVALHVGTLFSVVVFYRERITALVKGVFTGCKESWRMAINIVVSAIPAVIFYLLFRKAIDETFESTRFVGVALIFTGTMLCAVRWFSGKVGEITLPRAVAVGIAQAIAILPGVSRSGMTISTARITGIAPEKAAEFSFLMSLPLIVGAALLKGIQHSPSASDATAQAGVSFWLLVLGAAVAGVVGYFALTLLVRLLRGHQFWMFGIYCLIVGSLTLVFLK